MNTRHLSGLAGEVEMQSGEDVTRTVGNYRRPVPQLALRAGLCHRARQA
jgi:hypothetical protein